MKALHVIQCDYDCNWCSIMVMKEKKYVGVKDRIGYTMSDSELFAHFLPSTPLFWFLFHPFFSSLQLPIPPSLLCLSDRCLIEWWMFLHYALIELLFGLIGWRSSSWAHPIGWGGLLRVRGGALVDASEGGGQEGQRFAPSVSSHLPAQPTPMPSSPPPAFAPLARGKMWECTRSANLNKWCKCLIFWFSLHFDFSENYTKCSVQKKTVKLWRSTVKKIMFWWFLSHCSDIGGNI